MKKITLIILIVLAAVTAGFVFFRPALLSAAPESAGKAVYYCPMHPDFTSDKPGLCSICGMTLVKKDTNSAKKTGKNKILYYRNPMDPEVTSPAAMKDSMGMDYVPVYEEEQSSEKAGVYISPQKQQMIGVQKEKAEKRKLEREILTVGKVAYDPELYVAQEEYLQSLKTANAVNMSVLPSVSAQSQSLLAATKKKLILLGMTKEQIDELGKQGKAQENLYLPIGENTAWVYMTIYEYEIGLIKEGLPVEIEAVAYPGTKFEGKITAITPVLDAETRSLQVRAEVSDPEHKLKPKMFVSAKIKIDLGKKLAISEEAVINTGRKTLAVVTDEAGNFYSKEVILGQRAEGFYEILGGLNEGDTVVTSGNFLIDSESRLQSAISGEHKHGQ